MTASRTHIAHAGFEGRRATLSPWGRSRLLHASTTFVFGSVFVGHWPKLGFLNLRSRHTPARAALGAAHLRACYCP